MESVLVVEALDGADVGADDGNLGGGVQGALPQQRLPGPVVVVPQQGLGRPVLPRPRAAPRAVRALDVVVEAAVPLRLRVRRRVVGGVHYRPSAWVVASLTLPRRAPPPALLPALFETKMERK